MHYLSMFYVLYHLILINIIWAVFYWPYYFLSFYREENICEISHCNARIEATLHKRAQHLSSETTTHPLSFSCVSEK